ncbi:MAG: T9SS type A sorting domain-containing protein, partial [Ignavibacteriaceae bacterium]|nr:T9SS type A sorting domain-containing protein [Ignavibacteriaceae bacterium]
LVFGGKVNEEIRVNGNTHRAGLQPGIILPGGTPDTSTKPIYGIWKLKKGWENLPAGTEREYYEYIYNNWPADIGAPYIDINGDGEFTPGIDVPDYIGDMVLFYVANDMDSALSVFTYGMLPMGLEFQTSIFGFDRADDLKNVVFKKYRMINKGVNTIEDMFFGYWNDNDLGYAGDDYSGSDSLLDLSYTYNATNFDVIYGTPPPTVGHKIVQGPIVEGLPTDSAKFKGEWRKGYKNLSSYAFSLFSYPWRDPQQGVPEGSTEFYNYLNGLIWDGSPFIDPIINDTTKFCLAGDPYFQTGWYEGDGWPDGPSPGDRRQVISTGPFNLAPGDTQEVAIAILIAQGNDNIHSVNKLKQLAQTVQDFYDNDFVTSVENIKNIPLHFSLSQNYPNPFNPKTTIEYEVPEKTNVTIKIYDILGREVKTLVDNEEKVRWKYKVEFDASTLSSGVYFYQFKAGSFTQTKKMILLR